MTGEAANAQTASAQVEFREELEVRLRLRIVDKGGGMILSPSHAIQPETPLENILALYETGKTYGCYPIREN